MAITVGKLLALLDADPSGFDRGLAAAELKMHGFQRDVNGRLHDIHGRFISEGAAAGLGFGRGVEDGARRGLPGFGRVGFKLGFALKSSLIEAAVGGGAQLVTALAPAVGAIGLIPAAALAGGTALATLKIGLSGVGEALKNSGDPEKYAEALKHLAPAAQETVRALVGLKPAFDQVKMAVQQGLFAGLGGDIAALGRAYLPILRTELAGTAAGFNGVVRSIFDMLKAPGAVDSVSAALHNCMLAVTNIVGIIPGLVSGFLDIATVGSGFLPQLTAGFTALGDRFGAFIADAAESGRLASFISGGIDALKLLGGLLSDVGSILGSVFTAMGSAGGDALGIFGALIHTLADFFKTAQGMQALSALFAILGQVANAAGQILAQILPVVGMLLAAILPVLQPLIAMLTGGLIPVVVTLVAKLAGALVPVLGTLITALGPVLEALMPIVALIGGALGDVITALVPVITTLAQVISQILASALTALMPIFAVLLPVLVQIVQAVLPALIPLIQLVGKLFAALMPAIQPLIGLLVTLLVPILKLLTPIIEVLAVVIGALGQVLIWLITPIADFIGWLAKGLASAGTWRAIGHWFAELWRMVVAAFHAGVALVGRKWDEFIGLAKSIPGRITGALGDLGRLLWSKGQDLIRGLWNGIQGMGSWLASKLTGFVRDWIPGPIADALGIGSPSKVAAALGRWVPVGLAVGMDAGTAQVAAAAARMAAAAVPRLATPSIGQLAGAANARGAAGGVSFTAVVQIGNDQLEPHMVRVIEGNPVSVANANARGAKRKAYT